MFSDWGTYVKKKLTILVHLQEVLVRIMNDNFIP